MHIYIFLNKMLYIYTVTVTWMTTIYDINNNPSDLELLCVGDLFALVWQDRSWLMDNISRCTQILRLRSNPCYDLTLHVAYYEEFFFIPATMIHWYMEILMVHRHPIHIRNVVKVTIILFLVLRHLALVIRFIYLARVSAHTFCRCHYLSFNYSRRNQCVSLGSPINSSSLGRTVYWWWSIGAKRALLLNTQGVFLDHELVTYAWFAKRFLGILWKGNVSTLWKLVSYTNMMVLKVIIEH